MFAEFRPGARRVCRASLVPDRLPEPRTGVTPGVVGRTDGNAQRLGGLFRGQAARSNGAGRDGRPTGSVSANFERASSSASRSSASSSVVELGFVEDATFKSPAALRARLPPGTVDEDAPHGLGGRGEEMASAVPVRAVVGTDQPEVRLVNQGRGLERLAGLLLGQLLGGQLAQLVVDQGQELFGCPGTPCSIASENVGDVDSSCELNIEIEVFSKLS